jgi:serine protease Do
MNDDKQIQCRALSARRIALLATTIAGIGAVAILAPHAPPTNFFAAPALAQNLTQQAQQLTQRPVGFAGIVEKVKPAVISVRVKMERQVNSGLSNDELPFPPGSPFERFFRRFGMPNNGDGGREVVTGQGSGFFISADGYAVTNNHVVQNAETVQVTTDDGKTYAAKVIGADPRTDLALIKVDAKDFPYVKLGENAPRVGDWVLAVGNPFGLGGTVTAGIVSARGRDIGAGPYDDFIQIDAPVNKGNSGGPTFDVEGNVIGEGRDRAAARQGQRNPRLDRRTDSTGDPRHRRQPRSEESCRRPRLRAATRQPGGQGRYRKR